MLTSWKCGFDYMTQSSLDHLQETATLGSTTAIWFDFYTWLENDNQICARCYNITTQDAADIHHTITAIATIMMLGMSYDHRQQRHSSQVIVLSIHRIRADTTITKISHNNVSITNGEDSTSNEGVNTSGALLWAITSAKMCLVQIILHAITNKIALLPTVSLKTRSFSMCKFAQSSSQSLCRLEHTSR